MRPPTPRTRKKLAALLLSLLLCLSLRPGQALAADESAPVEPPAIEEPLNPEEPDDPGEPPVAPLSEVLDGKDSDQKGDG